MAVGQKSEAQKSNLYSCGGDRQSLRNLKARGIMKPGQKLKKEIWSKLMFNPKSDIRFSLILIILLSLLISLVAHHLWGFRAHQRTDQMEAVINEYEMIREDNFVHPLKDYGFKILLNTLFNAETLHSPVFNFLTGFFTKFFNVLLLFFILRTFIKNDVTILIIIAGLNSGLYVEPHSFSLSIRYATVYHFRDIASVFLLLSLLFLVRKRWVVGGLFLGITYLGHAKVGLRSLALLVPTILIWQLIEKRSLRDTAITALKLLVPSCLIILIYTSSSFIGDYIGANVADFPLYMMALKMEPDDFFFFHEYGVQKRLLLLMAGFSLLYCVFYGKREISYIRNRSGFPLLVFTIFFFLLYFFRSSAEVLLFLGAINMAFYYAYCVEKEPSHGKLDYLRNPLSIFTIVLTFWSVFGVSIEFFISYLPPWIGTVLYSLTLWEVLKFNTLISTVVISLLIAEMLHAFERKMTFAKLTPGIVKGSTVLLLLALSAGLLFFPRAKGDATLSFGLRMYEELFGSSSWDPLSYYPPEKAVYEEERVVSSESKQAFYEIRAEITQINDRIIRGDLEDVREALEELRGRTTGYLEGLRVNALANLASAEGNLRYAHGLYERAHSYRSAYPVFEEDGSLSVIPPARIPFEPYREAVLWIRQNIDDRAMFLNAPHIDSFTLFTRRNAFFQKMKGEGHLTALNANWAQIYLERQHDILGITAFDIPGFVFSYLHRPPIRYAFLELDQEGVAKILEKYPDIDYIFTESCHELPFEKVYENEFFVVYSLSN